MATVIAAGLKTPDICAKLFLSENTVRTHLKSIYKKTHATDRRELAELLRGKA